VSTDLECARCGRTHTAERLQNLCPCGGPLLARYDLADLARWWRPEDLAGRRHDLWRWRLVLPIGPDEEPLTLGEGGTPLLPSRRIGPAIGLDRLLLKDETQNPTGSFKARGMAVAVHRACALGAQRILLPSAGNAGSAAAAYSAAAGIPCSVVVPDDTPAPIVAETLAFGATVERVAGSIADAGRRVAERCEEEGGFDISTLREPYRVEGKKTMGYELAEALAWTLPDAIVYPTGGGTGLIGMWKAFEELETLGWIGAARPRMIAVQAVGCAPIVRAFEAGLDHAAPVADPRTVASGLRVPSAVGDFLMLDIIRRSGGTAVAVTDDELLEGARRLAREEGILAGPEAGAAVAALPALLEREMVARDARIVLFVTGHGLKYPALGGAA
jgi:threonine synthase